MIGRGIAYLFDKFYEAVLVARRWRYQYGLLSFGAMFKAILSDLRKTSGDPNQAEQDFYYHELARLGPRPLKEYEQIWRALAQGDSAASSRGGG